VYVDGTFACLQLRQTVLHSCYLHSVVLAMFVSAAIHSDTTDDVAGTWSFWEDQEMVLLCYTPWVCNGLYSEPLTQTECL